MADQAHAASLGGVLEAAETPLRPEGPAPIRHASMRSMHPINSRHRTIGAHGGVFEANGAGTS